MSEVKYELAVVPSVYKGWTLKYYGNADSDKFRAEKGNLYRHADTLDGLLRACSEAEEITVKLRRPLKAYRKDSYGGRLVRCGIVAVCGKRFVYRDEKGETHEGFLSNLSLRDGESSRRDWFADNSTNKRIREAIKALKLQIEGLTAKVESLRKRVVPLTEADVMTACKANTFRQVRRDMEEGHE